LAQPHLLLLERPPRDLIVVRVVPEIEDPSIASRERARVFAFMTRFQGRDVVGMIITEVFLSGLDEVCLVNVPLLRGAQAFEKRPIRLERIPAAFLQRFAPLKKTVNQTDEWCQGASSAGEIGEQPSLLHVSSCSANLWVIKATSRIYYCAIIEYA